MTIHDELLALERAAWEALSTDGAAGPFYEQALAREVLVLLPGGMVIDDRQAVVDSMGGAPWDRYEIEDARVLPLTPDSAVVAYRVEAQRGDFAYRALLNSTFVREDGEWRMALHQQTPL
ncbi:MAG TPA: nuclear transport factor 2 family protein [Acidimicrobiales bacterium]